MNLPSVILQGAFDEKAAGLAQQLSAWKTQLDKYKESKGDNPTAGDTLNWKRTERNIEAVELFMEAAFAMIEQLYDEIRELKRNRLDYRDLERAVKDYSSFTGMTAAEARYEVEQRRRLCLNGTRICDMKSITDIFKLTGLTQ